MKRKGLRAALVVAAAGSLALTGAGTAVADHGNDSKTVTIFKLHELNDTGASGIGIVKLRGNTADVRIFARGLLKANPHAQHFHIEGRGECPTQERDTNGDGIISTVEGQPDYGSIGTSLTTSGDTSPASGLAVDRFPTAPRGFVNYDRTFELSAAAAQDIRDGNAVIVLHGIDINNSGGYDAGGPSELNPALPLEATAPAACGNQTLLVNY